MKKQLLSLALITSAYATAHRDTIDMLKLAAEITQMCGNSQDNACKQVEKLRDIVREATQRREETGTFNWLEEEEQAMVEIHAAILKEYNLKKQIFEQ